ncbi:MAG TPA: radical SAM protein [Phycisphaerae bacterium]|nr:radical SAM protein [Phycisphaerae bacterium]HPM22540.1 radical SAM protein [Phycisphaerae bacterium]HQL53362.1 radical SAM protein [Phycisphaerae bacterium]
MRHSELNASTTTPGTTPTAATPEAPPQDGTLCPFVGVPPIDAPRTDGSAQRSGQLHRPFDTIHRTAVRADGARTALECFKVAMRRYAPVQKGRAGLPWAGQWQCGGCGQTVPGELVYDAGDDSIYLSTTCAECGPRRERHHDVLFVRHPRGPRHARQPQRTHSGAPIHPIITELPKTVETLCPECACLILGRYFIHDNAVWIEKTCPEHGYFRDKVNSDVALYLKGTRAGYQDERGVYEPQVEGASACPTDCGLCNQHHSASCLAQIDLTNRCNLTCPVCFASANQAGYLAEPTYEMVVEYLRALRNQHPYPATAIQFTGGEPTLHPDFHRIVRTACEMGFSHVQIATNGLRIADPEFAARAAEAGLHTLYMQFDGLDDEQYTRLRGAPLLEKKLRAVENCRQTGMKICLVPTIVKTVNDDQVAPIFRFAVEHADVVSAISYQPVAFTGRISHAELAQKRYTLGDLAHDLAACSGADVARDFFPLNFMTPLARVMQTLDGKPKIRPSCHSDCAFGTYFFVTPDRQAIPVPKLFDMARLMHGFNELAARIEQQRPTALANWKDKLDLVLTFLGSYRWTERDFRVTPFTFMHALRGLTNKAVGRGAAGRKTYRTLMAAGMHFMDRYNYDTERIKRCVILYSTPDGMYPFCTINGGPTYRPYLEQMIAQPLA